MSLAGLSSRMVEGADLWTLVLQRQHIDPAELIAAIERQIHDGDLDFRSRLLIRDSLQALNEIWGEQALSQWIERSALRDKIRTIASENLGPVGFPFLAKQLMETTTPDMVLQLLRELGLAVQQPARLAIGGSVALILANRLSRRTQDIDVVDEVPAQLRSQHEFLDKLSERHRLRLTHFQSHYLPAGWDQRLKSLGRFGKLDVFLVDEYDVVVSKLLSKREKDRDDLRVLAPQLDKALLVSRLKTAGQSLLKEPELRGNAADNWYIVYGEPLPA